MDTQAQADFDFLAQTYATTARRIAERNGHEKVFFAEIAAEVGSPTVLVARTLWEAQGQACRRLDMWRYSDHAMQARVDRWASASEWKHHNAEMHLVRVDFLRD